MSDGWEESTVMELPSGDDALEDEGCNNENLDNTPKCSQKALDEMFQF